MALLEIKNISKSYNDVKILDNICLTLDSGEMYIIKGRSGCGKSTLLNICSFLENPDSGELLFENILVGSLSNRERQTVLRNHIGYIFQDYNLFENFSVYENLVVYLLTTTDKNNSQISKDINEKLELVGIADKKNEKVKFLSGGERQRVALARAFLTPKKIIFADEPSANIDDNNIKIIKQCFDEMRKNGTSLLVVTHDNVFDDMADKIYNLERGILKCESLK